MWEQRTPATNTIQNLRATPAHSLREDIKRAAFCENSIPFDCMEETI